MFQPAPRNIKICQGYLCNISFGHLESIFLPEVFPKYIFFGSHSSGILVTRSVHLSCLSFSSVAGILSCHLISKSFLRQLK